MDTRFWSGQMPEPYLCSARQLRSDPLVYRKSGITSSANRFISSIGGWNCRRRVSSPASSKA